jgi:hypothetical protein
MIPRIRLYRGDRLLEDRYIIMSKLAEVLGHIKNHVKYPASRQQVVEACNNMSDIPSEDKEWVSKSLPDGTYKAPEDVMTALLRKA